MVKEDKFVFGSAVVNQKSKSHFEKCQFEIKRVQGPSSTPQVHIENLSLQATVLVSLDGEEETLEMFRCSRLQDGHGIIINQGSEKEVRLTFWARPPAAGVRAGESSRALVLGTPCRRLATYDEPAQQRRKRKRLDFTPDERRAGDADTRGGPGGGGSEVTVESLLRENQELKARLQEEAGGRRRVERDLRFLVQELKEMVSEAKLLAERSAENLEQEHEEAKERWKERCKSEMVKQFRPLYKAFLDFVGV
eukprot:748510-Hanusia_phi.AAC.2